MPPPTKPLSVNEIFRPQRIQKPSPRKSPKRPRLRTVPCPICTVAMSLVMLDTHINHCKPRPTRRAASAPTPAPSPPDTHVLHACLHGARCHFDRGTCEKHEHALLDATLTLRGWTPLPSEPTPPRVQLRLQGVPDDRAIPAVIRPLPPRCPAHRLPLPVLKSALQKCVRRGRGGPAVRIACAMIRKSETVFELLRRLTVIILEDAVLCPEFQRLVWLLAASSKGYRVSEADVAFILQVVLRVATVPCKDVGIFNPDATKPPAETQVTTDGTVQSVAMSPLPSGLVMAMRVRATYGGMGGDVAMIRSAASVWKGRFEADETGWLGVLQRAYEGQTASEPTEAAVRQWLMEGPVLRAGDIPLEAFDFHCCSIGDDITREIIGGSLRGRVPGVMERYSGGFEQVKSGVERLMWLFRSGVNTKRVWRDLEGAGAHGVAAEPECRSADEVLWRTELEGPVTEWCRRFKTRYGL